MSIIYLKKPAHSDRKRVTNLIEAEAQKDQATRARIKARSLAYVQDEKSLQGFGLPPLDVEPADEDSVERLDKARKALLGDRKMENMRDILPLLFNLRGEPYSIKDHFPFESFYNTRLCRNMVWKTGRQVAKSTNQACHGVLLSNLIPYFNTLFVTPQFELIRRFSSNYVQPFIMNSPIKGYFLDASCSNNVLQRTFRNKSIMYFSFAMLDCDRTRGLDCAKIAYDEVQDLDPSFIPIISEVMSASDWGLSQYTGTPKTLDGTLEQLWVDSSQAEWAIPCSCGQVSIPSIDQDLDAMMGPTRLDRDVSDRSPGVVCAKCGKPIDPRQGWWDHLHREKRFDFSGNHVPQLIMPMHYSSPEKWAILQGKRMGLGRTSTNIFYNECCGESYDLGAKLLTVTDLKRAATLNENTLEEATKVIDKYTKRFLAVDWGGGGATEISFTVAAVLGWKVDGGIDVIYGWRSLTPNDPIKEAFKILELLKVMRCSHLVHDFGGGGALRETLISHAGLPEHLIIPVAYQRVTAGPMIMHKPFNDSNGKRMHYMLDKTRSLQYTAEMIKAQHVKFFKYDYKNPDETGLLHDFLSLIEDKLDSRMGQELSTIIRNKQAGPDDFAHAVNIGVCALCHSMDYWPDLAKLNALQFDQSVLNTLSPVSDVNWADWN